MITAQEARAMNPNNKVEEILKDIEQRIKSIAPLGDTMLRVRDYGFGDSAWYGQLVPPGYDVQTKVIKTLNGLGFKATVKCEEKQFVDIYLEICW